MIVKFCYSLHVAYVIQRELTVLNYRAITNPISLLQDCLNNKTTR